LDRLLAGMEELKLLKSRATAAAVLVVPVQAPSAWETISASAPPCARQGLAPTFFRRPKKVGQQLQFAEPPGLPGWPSSPGPTSSPKGLEKWKNLARREEKTVAEADVVAPSRKP